MVGELHFELMRCYGECVLFEACGMSKGEGERERERGRMIATVNNARNTVC